ncbi:type II toxin-antitoxin system RelE/ParE family toxin [Rothia nasimurium]|uniref:Type II toxin-antitoxin system RelE/ParE family toxin n=1 Tax=Rothia nasimurium TaxID=85336 RepID=A0A4Y9F406_9MICC|nr:type II toxin-antitoxin system RelE/ParE family toxin [Rothia nasimurium]MBF0808481.1 type II toxin-antitoxin system RelE/ParE family toxin [Rothia nasimurium]TFU21973.1 type II toxin-antitoxin system RelE/ParE family toxin [Rothia nasimurium]
MKWELDFTPHAEKQLFKLDKLVARRITKELFKLRDSSNPKEHCKALTAQYSGLWRYRVGNYRVILDLNQKQLVILALEVGHRSKIYR